MVLSDLTKPMSVVLPRTHVARIGDMGSCIGWSRAVVTAVLLLTSMALVACGTTAGRSVQAVSTVSNGETAMVSTASDGEPTTGAGLDECLKKQGINTFEAPTHTEPTVGVGGVLGQGGMRVPVGVTRPQFEAALSKCGLGGVQVQGAPITNPTFRQRVLRLAACFRHDGFKVPAPNMSGNGPVFNTSGIEITDPRWRIAKRTCRVG